MENFNLWEANKTEHQFTLEKKEWYQVFIDDNKSD